MSILGPPKTVTHNRLRAEGTSESNVIVELL
jgi:hypothetical protein